MTNAADPAIGSALDRPAPLLDRSLAQAWDLVVVGGWAAFAAAAGACLRAIGVSPSDPELLDLQALLTLVAPVVVTFAWQEGSSAQATSGKRRRGLLVVNARGQAPGFPRAMLRSIAKFAPWQMAHTAIFHLLADSTAAAYLVLSIAAQGIVVCSVIVLVVDRRHRALHDLIAGTQVVPKGESHD